MDSLEIALNAYHTAMRWGYWEKVISFYHANTTDINTIPNKIRITAYNVHQLPVLTHDGTRAIQVVELQYVINEQQILRKILDKQEWHYDDATQSWQINSSLPKF
jgi:hypothetical protein